MFATVDVVVDGALEQSFVAADETSLSHWARQELDACTADGVVCEIFVVLHADDCDDANECVCAQFAADHRPWWSNREAF